MTWAKRLLREPLLHFLVLGSLIFAAYIALTGPEPSPRDVIVIGPERIAQLVKSHQAVWREPPSAKELAGLINEAVREEVYYREAINLGLDRNDTVIRRRLRQKMEFLTVSGVELLEPAAGELAAHLTANKTDFQRPPQIAFEQVFLKETATVDDIQIALKALQSGTEIQPPDLIRRSLLPATFSLSRSNIIDGSFGKGFFAQLMALTPGTWAGPVPSSYGNHLVRIYDFQAAYTPTLKEIHKAVFDDWKATKAKALQEQQYQHLRKRYAIEVHHPDDNKAERE
jgi:hypothetical protein